MTFPRTQLTCDVGSQGTFDLGSNVVEAAADVLRLMGHNVLSACDDMDKTRG